MGRLHLFVLLAFTCVASSATAADPPKRWNILWLTCEDTSPDLGCYGDKYAATPNLDKLAGQGARYTHCFSHAGVCAPSRSGLITGMYPTTLGSMHMRSRVTPPDHVKCFPEYLRAAGYYCTNNSKTDYNFDVPPKAWDENSAKAHWRNRPDKSQPFFAVFNFTVSHESQSRPGEAQYKRNTVRLTADQRHDPAKARLPAYYPDTPVVRKNWAICYDNVTAVDYLVADMLQELSDDGLADSTVVFFFGDHGRGLTRGKRWMYDSGLQVPLLVRWPGQIKPGAVESDLVAFVDLAPTVLSIAGVEIPSHLQGQAFLGPKKAAKPRDYIYGARDRMDERYDTIRAVRDQRFKYIRNYEPWKPYAQHVIYGDQMPILKEMRRMHAAGELTGTPALFFRETKPVEELYDCERDPDEVDNLAGKSEFQADLLRLREAHQLWYASTHDLGLVPEAVMLDLIAADPDHWREKLIASGLLDQLHIVASTLPVYTSFPKSSDHEAIRYWKLTCLSGRENFNSLKAEELSSALTDPSPLVRVAAARLACRFGRYDDALPIFERELENSNFAIALQAALTLDELGERARPAIPALQKANAGKRPNDYVMRVTAHALEQLGAKPANVPKT